MPTADCPHSAVFVISQTVASRKGLFLLPRFRGKKEVIDSVRTQRAQTNRSACWVSPGNPTLHYWTPASAAVPGWFTCGCGAVGVCEGCLATHGGGSQRPAAAVAVWCRTHHETVCGKRMPLSGAASLAL